MPPRYSHIVFDLDGTLVDSVSGIAAGLNAALHDLGKPTHTEAAIRLMIGEGARKLCALALGYAHEDELGATEISALLEGFTHHYRRTWQGEGTVCYPHVLDMLQRLKESGIQMGLLSNKPHEITALIAESLFPADTLHPALGYQEGIFPRKPHPAALQHIAASWGISIEDMLLVGDSIHDAHCAAHAGCQLILVSWGYARQEQLRRYCEQHQIALLDCVEELTAHLMA